MSAVPEKNITKSKSFQPIDSITSPQPFKLHIIHQEVSGLHQLVDLLQQLFFLLPVLLGLVLVCSTVTLQALQKIQQQVLQY